MMELAVAVHPGITAAIGLILGWFLGACTPFFASSSRLEQRVRLKTAEAMAAENRIRISEQQQQLLKSEDELRFAKAELARLQTAVEVAHTELRQQRLSASERVKLLERQNGEFARRFEAVSSRVFVDNSQRMADVAETQLGTLLLPFREQLQEFRKRVEHAYDKDSEDRHVLKAEISQLKQLNERISEDAINLTNALRGDSKAQGDWGELVLEKVLEGAGLSRGREYDCEVSFTDESGKRLRPDVLIHLPDRKEIIVDSKVSLRAYEKALAASGKVQREKWMQAHVRAIRKHVELLSLKEYESIQAINTLDFVLMFVPVEGALHSALQHDTALYRDSFDQDVVLVGPGSLMVTCRTIQNVWRSELQNKNAAQIARKAGEMVDRFSSFAEELDTVANGLARATDACETARRRLCSGRGNLVSRAKAIQQLGASGKKAVTV